jgi:hypothetical protein
VTQKKTDLFFVIFTMTELIEPFNKITIDLTQIVEQHLKNIFHQISVDYDICEKELNSKFLKDHSKISDNGDIEMKKKKNFIELPNESRCIANTAKFTRCTKRKLPGTKFCGFHRNKQQYGTIKEEKGEIVEVIKIIDTDYLNYKNRLYKLETLEKVYNTKDKDELKETILNNHEKEEVKRLVEGIINSDGSISLH